MGAQQQLEAPGAYWWPCTDMHDLGRTTNYCRCNGAGGELCGGCCSCLGGCVDKAQEAEHWAERLRQMSGQLAPCICWPWWDFGQDPSFDSSHWRINPSCTHHGDARLAEVAR